MKFEIQNNKNGRGEENEKIKYNYRIIKQIGLYLN